MAQPGPTALEESGHVGLQWGTPVPGASHRHILVDIPKSWFSEKAVRPCSLFREATFGPELSIQISCDTRFGLTAPFTG